jgi:hypothetical protein
MSFNLLPPRLLHLHQHPPLLSHNLRLNRPRPL